VLFAGWGLGGGSGLLSAIAEALVQDALALNRGRDRRVVELVDAIEAKDRYTVGHVPRGVAGVRIGKQLGLSAAELREVVLAAQMRDVGKIGTPTAILPKPGALTGDEMTEMRRHTVFGSGIAGQVRALRPCHRQCGHTTGSSTGGYRTGCVGRRSVAARIVSVADTYGDRGRLPGAAHEAAISEIRRCGDAVDPRCVDAFRHCLGGGRRRDLASE
jgi:HD-GYP domain-containing protein (c-di-GMP phosphodiesterase class II)